MDINDTFNGDLEFIKSNHRFLGYKAHNVAAQGAPQFCQREGLTYEQMDAVSQCLVVCMILQARLGISDYSILSEELRLLGTDTLCLMR